MGPESNVPPGQLVLRLPTSCTKVASVFLNWIVSPIAAVTLAGFGPPAVRLIVIVLAAYAGETPSSGNSTTVSSTPSRAYGDSARRLGRWQAPTHGRTGPHPSYRRTMLSIGAHVGQADPVSEAKARKADLVQFFLGDPQDWKAPVVPDLGDTSGLDLYVHAPYIVNVASGNNKIRIPSRKILAPARRGRGRRSAPRA